MAIRVLVNGAFGHMGRLSSLAIAADTRFSLVGQTGRTHPLATSIKDSAAEVVIDFTSSDSVFDNAKTIIEAGARPVIGTSGLTAEQMQVLRTLCEAKKRGGVIAPNFSLGAVLMIKYASEIVKYMPHVEILEMHRANKPDSPSGTAMHSAEKLAEACATVNQPAPPLTETIPHSRGANYNGIPIHAIRLPGLLAQQQIIFGNTGETLTLIHNSLDRKCFIPGVLLASEKVMTFDRLVCGLEGILNGFD